MPGSWDAAATAALDFCFHIICTDRRRHAGIEGSGVPDLKAERDAKRAAKKALREAHGACLQAMQTAVRTHTISHDAALAHVLRMAIDDAVPPTGRRARCSTCRWGRAVAPSLRATH